MHLLEVHFALEELNVKVKARQAELAIGLAGQDSEVVDGTELIDKM